MSASKWNPWRVRLLIGVLLVVVVVGSPCLACPQLTVEMSTRTLPWLKGRILAPGGVPEYFAGLEVEFIVAAVDEEVEQIWEVPVTETGEFDLDLPEGLYVYSLKIKQYIFTLEGEVVIRRDADREAELVFDPPYC